MVAFGYIVIYVLHFVLQIGNNTTMALSKKLSTPASEFSIINIPHSLHSLPFNKFAVC